MDAWTAPQTRDRYDRHVRCARLSVDSSASQHRLKFAIEEALRLASLPGENEGRSYYFRHLRISGLPANGDRNIWLEKFQRALSEEAEQAMHGADPRAGFADAVFFRGEQEALEILLRRILARRVAAEWFWPMVTGVAGGGEPVSSAAAILHVIEKLRAQPASWVAVAAALFAAPEFDVVRLLQAIPPALAQGWIREMEGPRSIPSRVAGRIPQLAQPVIQRVLKAVGFHEIRTLWLTTLAILVDSPAELAAGTAVLRARGALSRLISEAEIQSTEPGRLDGTKTIGLAGDEGIATAPSPASKESRDAAPLPLADAQPLPDGQSPPDATTPDSSPVALSAVPSDPAIAAVPEVSPSPDHPPADHAQALGAPARSDVPVHESESTSSEFARLPDPTPWQCIGLPTTAAGLFFLLNALDRVGISEALATGLASAGPNFAARVLQRLAAQAGVAEDDPIMIWLNSLVPRESDEQTMPCEPSSWPSDLQPARDAAPTAYLIRIWGIAARRWCWRAGKVGLRDVVSRAGVFSVNRTELDVSLRIEEADIRVRRIGLDLDPGWLPWFGRVVRFHYLFRGEFHG